LDYLHFREYFINFINFFFLLFFKPSIITDLKISFSVHHISDGKIIFPSEYGFKERDLTYYTKYRVNQGGCDYCLIAYDSILWACQFYDRQEMVHYKNSMNTGSAGWFELQYHAAMYKGMTSTTASIACAWYGAQNGLRGIPVQNYKGLECVWKMQNIGNALESAKGKME